MTRMTWSEGCFAIQPAEGDRSLLPARRSCTLEFWGIGPEEARMLVNGQPVEAPAAYDQERHVLTLQAPDITPADRLEVRFAGAPAVRPNDRVGQIFRLLYKAEMSTQRRSGSTPAPARAAAPWNCWACSRPWTSTPPSTDALRGAAGRAPVAAGSDAVFPDRGAGNARNK